MGVIRIILLLLHVFSLSGKKIFDYFQLHVYRYFLRGDGRQGCSVYAFVLLSSFDYLSSKYLS